MSRDDNSWAITGFSVDAKFTETAILSVIPSEKLVNNDIQFESKLKIITLLVHFVTKY